MRKGCNWCSITNDFCSYLISKENEICKRYYQTFCADENFLQTVLWNSPFKKNVYSTIDEYGGSLRAIDWNKGNPYTWWHKEDPDMLIDSNCLFVKKFNEDKYPWIVNEIKQLTR